MGNAFTILYRDRAITRSNRLKQYECVPIHSADGTHLYDRTTIEIEGTLVDDPPDLSMTQAAG